MLMFTGPDNHTCESGGGCKMNNGGCSHTCIDSYNQVQGRLWNLKPIHNLTIQHYHKLFAQTPKHLRTIF